MGHNGAVRARFFSQSLPLFLAYALDLLKPGPA